MEPVNVVIWKSDDGWCVTVDGDHKVFVYGTMRSALNKVESLVKELNKEEVKEEE